MSLIKNENEKLKAAMQKTIRCSLKNGTQREPDNSSRLNVEDVLKCLYSGWVAQNDSEQE